MGSRKDAGSTQIFTMMVNVKSVISPLGSVRARFVQEALRTDYNAPN